MQPFASHAGTDWVLVTGQPGCGKTTAVKKLVDELRARIERYRRKPFEPLEDPEIGCVLLNSVQFFPQDQLLAAPNDFAMNIVRGRTYSIGEVGGGHSVVEAVLKHRARSELTDAATHVIYGHTRGEPIVTIPRIGQQAFKAVIEENFHHRCAVTGDRVRPVLQAAHVLPVSEGGEHRVDNGLLLRSSLWRLAASSTAASSRAPSIPLHIRRPLRRAEFLGGLPQAAHAPPASQRSKIPSMCLTQSLQQPTSLTMGPTDMRRPSTWVASCTCASAVPAASA